jgi:sporulation protein YqfC
VENYKAIIEYEKDLIRLNNNVSILGENLNIAEITSDEIIVNGKIKSIEF